MQRDHDDLEDRCVGGALTHCVGQYRGAPREMELEVRLGHCTAEGNFIAGIEEEHFVQLDRDLSTECKLVGDAKWEEVLDVFYTLNKRRLRTRVTYDVNKMCTSVEHVAKDTRQKVVLRSVTPHESGSEEEQMRWNACAVVAAREQSVSLPVEATAPVPTFVRLKQRRCFLDVRDGSVVWKYELSKTWSAPTRTALENLRYCERPVHEVECELVDTSGKYLTSLSDAEIADSILLKSKMLLGVYESLVVVRKN
jgi:hypothetical protein